MNAHVTTFSVIGFLIDAYPRQEIGEGTIEVYRQTLADIPPEILKAAVLVHVARSQWFPAVAELRDAAAGLVERAMNIPSAFEAWDEVARLIRQVGSWGTPAFSNPLIGKAVAGVGGWLAICMSENQIADRARFFQVYEAYARREEDDHRMLPEVANVISKLALRLDGRRDMPRLSMLVYPGTGEVLEVVNGEF
jgi:hypothetical protein